MINNCWPQLDHEPDWKIVQCRFTEFACPISRPCSTTKHATLGHKNIKI